MKRNAQCLFEERKAEAVGNVGHLIYERVRELDFIIASKLVLPVLYVQDPFFLVRITELTAECYEYNGVYELEDLTICDRIDWGGWTGPGRACPCGWWCR